MRVARRCLILGQKDLYAALHRRAPDSGGENVVPPGQLGSSASSGVGNGRLIFGPGGDRWDPTARSMDPGRPTLQRFRRGVGVARTVTRTATYGGWAAVWSSQSRRVTTAMALIRSVDQSVLPSASLGRRDRNLYGVAWCANGGTAAKAFAAMISDSRRASSSALRKWAPAQMRDSEHSSAAAAKLA